MGLCLCYFLTHQSTAIVPGADAVRVRVTKVIGAQFLEPVLPGTTMTLVSRRLQAEPFLEIYLGQVMIDQKVCSVSIGEICIL
jgi:3-hydroxyacyl-[acyl-carrier-protein] dehydratase